MHCSRPFAALMFALLLLGSFLPGCNQGDEGIRVAYITNGTAPPFWTLARQGALDAAKALGVHCDVKMPPGGTTGEQLQYMELFRSQGYSGLAISPIAAAGQTDQINATAKVMNVITHDSDAPDSDRLCFVGIDNYHAGRLVGKLVKEALPEGGEVMLFIGNMDQDNAQRRRQGVIDELLDRERHPEGKFDNPDATFLDGTYKILGTKVDSPIDEAKALENAQATVTKYPNLACMVGLFAYHPRTCLRALPESRRGVVKIVGFDEAEETLQGILDGHIHGTVAQDPYNYGYKSVEILTKLAQGDKSAIPEGEWYQIPPQVIRRDEAEALLVKVKRILAAQ